MRLLSYMASFSENMPLAQMRVLCVARDASRRAAMGKALAELGAEPLYASDGNMAQYAVASEKLDSVITEALVPGHNGIELLHFVKRISPELPVVLVAGEGEVELSEAMGMGARGFLPKLFAKQDLQAVMVQFWACSHPRNPG